MIGPSALVVVTMLAAVAPDEGNAHTSSPSALSAQLPARDRSRIERVSACLAAQRDRCRAALPPVDVDDATLARLLKTRARDPESNALQRSLARAVIEDALQAAEPQRSAMRRARTFVDGGAVFAVDDIRSLLAQKKRNERARILAAAKGAIDVDDDRAALDRIAARAGITRSELLARRVGLDAASLKKLATSTLSATASYLGPVASDVTLLPDLEASVDVNDVVDAMAPDIASADPIFRAALAWDAPREVRDPKFRAKRLRSLVIDTRASALAVLALLDDADAEKRDALASRILDDTAAPLAGASAFLPVSGGGAVVDRFVADLEAPSIAQHLWTGEAMPAIVKRFESEPPVDEQGFPEAFIEVLKALQEMP